MKCKKNSKFEKLNKLSIFLDLKPGSAFFKSGNRIRIHNTKNMVGGVKAPEQKVNLIFVNLVTPSY